MSVKDALEAYCAAFEAAEPDAVASLFAQNGLYELPLLGQRLVGRPEIRAGLERVFALARPCSIELAAVKCTATTAIAEGRLRATLRRRPAPVEIPLAMVAQTEGEKLTRLSSYLDARPYRLWSDGPILAPAE